MPEGLGEPLSATGPGSPAALATVAAETAAGLADGDLRALRRAVFVAVLSHFCLGYNTGVIAGAILDLQAEENPAFTPLDSLSKGVLVSCVLASAAVGALLSQAADAIGRRRLLLAVAVLYVLGPLGMAVAPRLWALVLARSVAGVGVGVSSALVNVYISELAPASCRGRLGGWAPFVGTTGILVSYIVSSAAEALSPHTGGTWRWQVGIAALPALLQLLLHGSLPETPPWLLSKGRSNDAAAALAALFPKAAPEVLAAELQELQVTLTSAGAPASMCAVCAQHPRAAALGVGVNVLQQVTGINVVIYFGPQILKYAGFSDSASMYLTAIISFLQLAATLCLIGTVDRVGRKPLAKLGIMLMACGLLLIVAAFSLKAGLLGGWIALGGMLLFRAAFSLSLGPLPYIMTSEFFQQESRAAGVALSWASNWAANCAVSLTFPLLVGSAPSSLSVAYVFLFYAGCSVLAFAFVRRWLPETAGLRLEAACRGPPGGGRDTALSAASA